jgi:PhnB protein
MPEKAVSPVPAGLHTLTPQLWFNGDCAAAIEFYRKALGAEIVGEVAQGPDDMGVMHAMLKVGDACFMLADAMPGAAEVGPADVTTSSFWLYDADCDAAFQRACDAGAEILQPLEDMFWGDRLGKVVDPFGHVWAIATCQWKMSEEEMKAGMEKFVEAMRQEA